MGREEDANGVLTDGGVRQNGAQPPAVNGNGGHDRLAAGEERLSNHPSCLLPHLGICMALVALKCLHVLRR